MRFVRQSVPFGWDMQQAHTQTCSRVCFEKINCWLNVICHSAGNGPSSNACAREMCYLRFEKSVCTPFLYFDTCERASTEWGCSLSLWLDPFLFSHLSRVRPSAPLAGQKYETLFGAISHMICECELLRSLMHTQFAPRERVWNKVIARWSHPAPRALQPLLFTIPIPLSLDHEFNQLNL